VKSTHASAGAAKKRCAIYTRKSTTAGLEQEFNSLDAQREACLAYIASRLDWKAQPESYDDGGFTGANIDRPAFQRLLGDVETRKIDIVLVYKVDRLSRSLLDFVKVMERLSAAGASFVSVTQNFSTADAMGRLTLNMLMSFAEFEREMISERTRDKICAARRRGKWTGGPVPFGYDVRNKRLAVNEAEATVVREAFRLFLEHRQAATVGQSLSAAGKGDPLWTKTTVSRVLRNPIYVGMVRCGPELHPGEHAAIIDRATFEAVQAAASSSPRGECKKHENAAYLLMGLLRCARCQGALTPGSTRRDGREYRYYRCTRRDKHGRDGCTAKPMRAAAIEEHVVARIAGVSLPRSRGHLRCDGGWSPWREREGRLRKSTRPRW
jgi:site-specific DNA recombinase